MENKWIGKKYEKDTKKIYEKRYEKKIWKRNALIKLGGVCGEGEAHTLCRQIAFY